MKKILAVLVLGLFFAPSAHAAFDTDLRYGSTGAPVLELQEFLTAQGVYTGPISGNFYSLTLAGVKSLQIKLGVSPQSGFFGPLTRAAASQILSADLAESDAEASSTPTVNVPQTPVKTRRVHTSSTVTTSTGGTGTTTTATAPAAPAFVVYRATFSTQSDNLIGQINASKEADSSTFRVYDGDGNPVDVQFSTKETRHLNDSCFVRNAKGEQIDRVCGGIMTRLNESGVGSITSSQVYTFSVQSIDGDTYTGQLDVTG